MGDFTQAQAWQPVSQGERCCDLDVLRGLALFGVLLVNLLGDFRIALAEHLLTFHTDSGWVDRAVDVLVACFLEFKAFALFSLLFGAGLAVFAERAAARNVAAGRFLRRRLLVLLALGLVHLLLIWNGDILTLYAVCGLLLLPLLRLSAMGLASAGVLALALMSVLPLGLLWPGDATMSDMAAEAATAYSEGSFADVLAFHWRETRLLILLLVALSLPRTWGLMALGAAVWRAGVFREPARHRALLVAVMLVGGIVGGLTTALSVYSQSTGRPVDFSPLFMEAFSSTPLALAYAAAVLLVLRSPRVKAVSVPFAAAGQMALTNYLTQSVVLSLLFYSYGLGLFGRLGSASAALIGVVLYGGQLAASRAWLRHFRFGPVEWLWRSLTYGGRQPMRRVTIQVDPPAAPM